MRSLLGQFGGAVLGGVLFAPLAYVITGYAFMGAGLGMGLLTVQLFGIIVGFGIGAGLGAGLVGRWQKQPGSMWLAVLLGAVVGLITGPGAVLLLRAIDGVNVLGGILVLGIPLTLIAAVVGYNLRRS